MRELRSIDELLNIDEDPRGKVPARGSRDFWVGQTDVQAAGGARGMCGPRVERPGDCMRGAGVSTAATRGRGAGRLAAAPGESAVA